MARPTPLPMRRTCRRRLEMPQQLVEYKPIMADTAEAASHFPTARYYLYADAFSLFHADDIIAAFAASTDDLRAARHARARDAKAATLYNAQADITPILAGYSPAGDAGGDAGGRALFHFSSAALPACSRTRRPAFLTFLALSRHCRPKCAATDARCPTRPRLLYRCTSPTRYGVLTYARHGMTSKPSCVLISARARLGVGAASAADFCHY